MMTFTRNRAPITRAAALKHLSNMGHYHQGMDRREVEAIFARAMHDSMDGEDARDMLAAIDDTIEIFVR